MMPISVPCSKCSVVARHGAWRWSSQHLRNQLVSVSKSCSQLLAGSHRNPLLQVHNQNQCPILRAQVREVAFETSIASLASSATLENLSSDSKEAEVAEESIGQAAVSDSAISSFIAEVSNLVKLVDSRDITELQLKRKDCEIIIKKQEASPQPVPPLIMMQPPPQAAFPPHTPLPHAVPTPTPIGPTPSSPPPALLIPGRGSKSSLPPLKCPMAGTFYLCPAPGEPPFVKVGDKVQKGQVVCIIEAMKLMNEIEADQSGTVVEVLAEDGKPVSVDMPLLIIEP